ncbi:aminomethyltransferase beta-barrel domain-containing protein [Staphylococcus aureus]
MITSIASDYSFVNPEDNDLDQGFECTAKFRYRQKDTKVFVKRENDHALRVLFAEPVSNHTWTSSCFYQGDVCLGGATIDDVFKNEGQLNSVV